jgi:phosphodiesterase/alkaline phosphatase D-like protein
MERFPMLMDWQDQNSKNGYLAKKQSTDSMQSPSIFQLNSSMN